MKLLNCIKNKRLDSYLRSQLIRYLYEPYDKEISEIKKEFCNIVKDLYKKYLFTEEEIEYFKKCDKYLNKLYLSTGSYYENIIREILPDEFRFGSRDFKLPLSDPSRKYKHKPFEKKSIISSYEVFKETNIGFYSILSKELGIKIPNGKGVWWGEDDACCEDKIINELNKPENSEDRDKLVEITKKIIRKIYLRRNMFRDDSSIFQNELDQEPFQGIYTFNQLYSVSPSLYERLVKDVYLEPTHLSVLGHSIQKELSWESDTRPISEKLSEIELILGL